MDALLSTVSTFHTTGIILADNSKFSFVGLIPEAMVRDMPAVSKIFERFCKLGPYGFRIVTPEMQAILAVTDKLKKSGQKGKKKGEKKKGIKRVNRLRLRLQQSESIKFLHLNQFLRSER